MKFDGEGLVVAEGLYVVLEELEELIEADEDELAVVLLELDVLGDTNAERS
jgi:hypothetical protein